MEQRVHRRFQLRLHHLLRDPIRHGRYAQLPFPTVRLRYLHRPHRRWKVTARRHPIPDLEQVPFQVPLKIHNRLLVPLPLLGSLSLAYTLPRPPTWKYRTALPHSSAPPIAGWLIEFRLHNTTPSLHPFVEDFLATTGCSVPGLRFRTLALVVLPLAASPFASESQVPTFRSIASDKLRPP